MRRLIQFVARLYPASWRRRYEIEFAALLEDVDPDWHTFINVLRGVVNMQIRMRKPGNIVSLCALAGAVAGLFAWSAIPNQYASTAVLKVVRSPLTPGMRARNEALADYVNSLAERSTNRSSLIQMIETLKPYEPELKKIPLSDVLSSMKKNITVRPIGPQSDIDTTRLSLRFSCGDPVAARRVVQELATAFLSSNLDDALVGNEPNARGVTIEIVDTPTLDNHPFGPRLSVLMTAGATGGLASAALLVAFRRSIRPA